MNPITFNTEFEGAIEKHPLSKELKNIFQGWGKSPLFDYITTFDKEVTLLPEGTSMEELQTMAWPFETLRLALTEKNVPLYKKVNDKLADYVEHLVLTRKEGRVFCLWQPKEIGHDPVLIRELKPTIVFIFQTQKETAIELYFKGKWVSDTNMVVPADFIETAKSSLTKAAAFLIDTMSPQIHIASVHPNNPNKSVEWVRARTHYTLITHGHPANQRQIQTGERIKSDVEMELRRMAHNRRAHKRLLKSDKYRFKKGQLIDVRACWVGPKEWQDEGGKQIYQILEEIKD